MGIVSVCKMTGAKSPLACFVCPVVAPAAPPVGYDLPRVGKVGTC